MSTIQFVVQFEQCSWNANDILSDWFLMKMDERIYIAGETYTTGGAAMHRFGKHLHHIPA